MSSSFQFNTFLASWCTLLFTLLTMDMEFSSLSSAMARPVAVSLPVLPPAAAAAAADRSDGWKSAGDRRAPPARPGGMGIAGDNDHFQRSRQKFPRAPSAKTMDSHFKLESALALIFSRGGHQKDRKVLQCDPSLSKIDRN